MLPPVSPVPVREVENEDETDLMEEERVLSAHIASIHKERSEHWEMEVNTDHILNRQLVI